MIRRAMLTGLAVAAAASAGACEAGGRGSVGEGGAAAGFTVDPAPVLGVGLLEGDTVQLFDGVVDPFVLPNGNLVVPNRGPRTVRIFDAGGGFVRSLGGPGEGPGEFVSLRNAWPRGDTVEVWDDRALRITRFLPGGDVDVVGMRGTGSATNVDGGIGPFGDGWVLVSVAFGPDGRDVMRAEWFGRDGRHAGTLAEFEGMVRHTFSWGGGPHPLSPTGLLEAHGAELYTAEAERALLLVHGPRSELLREVPLPLEPYGAPDEVLRQVIDSAAARADEGREDAVRQRWTSYPVPELLPLLWALIADTEGLLWIRPYDPFRHALALGGEPGGRGGPGGSWLVLAPDGTERARVEMPEGLEPTQITRTAVVGIHRDELGVESVRVHTLVRPAG